MSHYLAFRFIKDENINFFENLKHTVYKSHPENEITPVKTVEEMDRIICQKIEEFYLPGKTAILLSGGIWIKTFYGIRDVRCLVRSMIEGRRKM